jgi:hypothetical protein
MNIFVLDKMPHKSAEYLDDKRVVKMITETAQMLSTAFYQKLAPKKYAMLITTDKRIYKPAYYNHPCTVWTRESYTNWMWLKTYGIYLYKEYKARYGKIHKAGEVIKQFPDPTHLPKVGLTSFAQAMPDQYKNTDTVKAYRDYFIGEKLPTNPQWKTGKIPYWIKKLNII